MRTNAQATVISEAFTRARIPHRVRGAGDLMEQPEVRQAIGALRRASNLQMGLGDLEEEVRRLAPDLQPGESPATGTDPGAPGGAAPPAPAPRPAPSGPSLTEERAANLVELVRLGREYLALDPDGGIPGFMGWLTSALRGEDRSGGDAVEVVTFHAAKGLEWPVVHVAGLEEGFVPIHHSKDDPAAVEEERRLLYVALTRARDELHCTWARTREFGSRSLNRKPSPWLDVISTTVGSGPVQVDRREGAARARAARRKLPREGEPRDPKDQALFEALRAWRRDQSREADVAAYVIFNDATLTALCQQRPRTRKDLLKVPGIGAVKAQRFGDDVLAIIGEHPR